LSHNAHFEDANSEAGRTYREFFDNFVESRELDSDPATWPEGVLAEWRILFRGQGDEATG